MKKNNINIKLLKNNKKGFSLLGIMLGMFIFSGIIASCFVIYRNSQISKQGQLAGEQIRILGQAVDEYISIHHNMIANLESDQNLKCNKNGICEITVDGLRNSGELINSFSNVNTFGSEYKIQIKREGNPPEYKISGLVITTKSPDNKPLKVLGFAVQTGGANAGNNLIDPQIISGNSGAWKYTKNDFNIISDSEYQLAYRVGYNASQYSPYLRRDGTLPMTGNLNLDKYNINNAKSINAEQANMGEVNTNKINANEGQINNNININGHTNTGSLHVNGDANINGRLIGDLLPKQTVQTGNNCSPNGLIGKDQIGNLLSCVNGFWANIGGQSSGVKDYLYFDSGSNFPRYGLSVNEYLCTITSFKHIGGVTNSYHASMKINNGMWRYSSAGGTASILCVKR